MQYVSLHAYAVSAHFHNNNYVNNCPFHLHVLLIYIFCIIVYTDHILCINYLHILLHNPQLGLQFYSTLANVYTEIMCF